MERIDKILSVSLGCSRTDAKVFIRRGVVFVDGDIVKSSNQKVDEVNSQIICNGSEIVYNKYVYIMLNKPKGVVSASKGEGDVTVIDILPDEMKRKNLFPAGRLDKDTTGFVLITDDGEFAHNILSPKKHIEKTYIARLDKPFGENEIKAFENGIELKDGVCMPATLRAINSEKTLAQVIIKQGMYHQIKRMFAKFGLNVVELKRIKMGGLELDENLKEGQARYITRDEKSKLWSKT